MPDQLSLIRADLLAYQLVELSAVALQSSVGDQRGTEAADVLPDAGDELFLVDEVFDGE